MPSSAHVMPIYVNVCIDRLHTYGLEEMVQCVILLYIYLNMCIDRYMGLQDRFTAQLCENVDCQTYGVKRKSLMYIYLNMHVARHMGLALVYIDICISYEVRGRVLIGVLCHIFNYFQPIYFIVISSQRMYWLILIANSKYVILDQLE